MGRRALTPGEIGTIAWDVRPDGTERGRAYARTGGGDRVRLSSTRATREEMAADLQAQARALVYAADDLSPATPLRDVISAWLEDRAEEGRGKPQTLAGYGRTAAACIVPRLGDVSVGELTPPRVRELMRALKEETHRSPRAAGSTRAVKRGYSDAYRRQALIVLRGALDHAVRLGLITANPAGAEPMPQRKPQEAQPLDAGQVRVLRAAILDWESRKNRGATLRHAVELGLATGARIGEVTAFQICGLADLPTYSIALDGTIIEKAGGAVRQPNLKGSDKERRLPLPAWVRVTIDEAIESAPSRAVDATILQTARGRCVTPSFVQNRLRAMRNEQRATLEAAGTDVDSFSFHSLRSTVLAAIDRGADIETAQAHAGHSSSVITRGYLGARDELPLVDGGQQALEALG